MATRTPRSGRGVPADRGSGYWQSRRRKRFSPWLQVRYEPKSGFTSICCLHGCVRLTDKIGQRHELACQLPGIEGVLRIRRMGRETEFRVHAFHSPQQIRLGDQQGVTYSSEYRERERPGALQGMRGQHNRRDLGVFEPVVQFEHDRGLCPVSPIRLAWPGSSARLPRGCGRWWRRRTPSLRCCGRSWMRRGSGAAAADGQLRLAPRRLPAALRRQNGARLAGRISGQRPGMPSGVSPAAVTRDLSCQGFDQCLHVGYAEPGHQVVALRRVVDPVAPGLDVPEARGRQRVDQRVQERQRRLAGLAAG